MLIGQRYQSVVLPPGSDLQKPDAETPEPSSMHGPKLTGRLPRYLQRNVGRCGVELYSLLIVEVPDGSKSGREERKTKER